jgi:predicted MFS family arabinose efflux permease
MQTESDSPRIFSPLFIHVFILNFITLLGYMVLSLVPPYLTDKGATKLFVGFFMNTPALSLLLFVLIFSRFTNLFDRKKFLVGGNILFFLCHIAMYFLAENIWLLLFLRMVSSISFAFGFSMHMSLVYDVLPASRRAGGIAFFGISGLLASPLGSRLAEFCIDMGQTRWLFLVAGGCGLTAAFVALALKQPKQEQHAPDSIPLTVWGILSRRTLFFLIVVSVIFGGIFSIFVTFIPDYTNLVLGSANLSSFFIPYAGMAITSRLLFAGIMHRFSAVKLVRFALFLSVIAMGFMVKIYSIWQISAIGLLYGLAHAILFPCLSATFINQSGPAEKAVYNSAYLSLLMSGQILFPALLGMVADAVGYFLPGWEFQLLFAGMTIIIAAGFFLSFYITAGEE